MEKFNFGNRLKELRKSVGITQAQLADALHERRATLSNYENKKSPSFLVMKSFYDPKAYHLLSKRNLKLTILYLIILSFVINVFTLILPYAPIIIKNHGVKQMLNVAIPDFEYNNGEIAIDTFKCDINEKDNSIAWKFY